MGRLPDLPASIAELRKKLSVARSLESILAGLTREGKLEWVRSVLSRFQYDALSRDDKGTLKQYLEKTTGYSRAQMTRLIATSRTAIREAAPEMFQALKPDIIRRPFAFTWAASSVALMLLVLVRGFGGTTTGSLMVLSGDLEHRITGLEQELHGPRAHRIVTERLNADGSVALDPLLFGYNHITAVGGELVQQNFVALTARELETKVAERRGARAARNDFGMPDFPAGASTILTSAEARRIARLSRPDTLSPFHTEQTPVFPNYDVSGERIAPDTAHGSAPVHSVARSNTIIDALGGGNDGQILMIEDGLPVWRDMPFREQIRELAPHGEERSNRGSDGGRRGGSGGGGGGSTTSTTTNTTTTITQTIDSAEWTDGGTTVYLTTTSDYVAIGATTADAKLEVIGTISGSTLYAADSLRSSGTLIVDGTGTFNGNTVFGDATADTVTFTGRIASNILPATDALYNLGSRELRFGSGFFAGQLKIGSTITISTDAIEGSNGITFSASGANALVSRTNGSERMRITSAGLVGIGTASPDTLLEIIGTASGRDLYARDSLRSSGSLVWEGSASGAVLWVSQFNGAGLVTTCDPTTGKLTWNATTKQFVCGTDLNTGSTYTAAQGLTLNGSNAFSLTASFSGTALEILGTSSGRILYGADKILGSGTLLVDGSIRSKTSLRSSGTLAIDGVAYLNDEVFFGSGFIANGVTYRFPISAPTATGKVLKVNTNGDLVWSTDLNTGSTYTAAQGLTLNGSNAFSLSTSFSGTALEILGTASGKSLRFATGFFTATGAAMVPLTVKGATSQSANLQEWQNSAGTSIASITSAGDINTRDGGSVYINPTYGTRIYDTGGDGYQVGIYNRYGTTFLFRNSVIGPYFSLGGSETYTPKIRNIAAASALDSNQLNGGGSVTPLSLVGLYGGAYTGNERHATDIYAVLGYGGTPPSGTVTGGNGGKFVVSLQAGGLGSGGAANGADGSFNVQNSSYSDVFKVQHDGKVGIGTTAPGSRLSVSGAVIIGPNIGSIAADTGLGLEVIGSVSGSTLYATSSLRSSGSLVWEGSASGAVLWVSQFGGAGLTDCDNATNSKVLWDATNQRFSCGSDQGGSNAPTAGQGLTLNGGNAFSLTASFSGTALEILGTASGRILHAQDELRSSGSLITETTATIGTDLTILGGDITGAAGAALDLGEATSGDITVTGDFLIADNSFFGLSSVTGRFEFDDQTTDEFNILNANVGIGTATPTETLEVIGTASGRILHAQDTLSSSGSLVWEGSASGASLWVSQFNGAGLITTCDPTTGKLTWNATTKNFVCGTDSGTAYSAGQGILRHPFRHLPRDPRDFLWPHPPRPG
ncbi:MAG: hypothetical protein Greene101449_267 [Candidatus Peregrinibacteria bacterium Greene1014_49]|nr:MAG: hypothetical protein Greene101449_267 [Candidatus Peregrinibacteria bacterium Greene1014_49]